MTKMNPGTTTLDGEQHDTLDLAQKVRKFRGQKTLTEICEALGLNPANAKTNKRNLDRALKRFEVAFVKQERVRRN